MSFDLTAEPFMVLAVICVCGCVSLRGYSLRDSVEIRYLPYTNISEVEKENDT
jgi:hypothetical protein